MASTQAGGSSRLSGIDVARALAVFGMVIVNVGSTDPKGLQGELVGLLTGRAAILFIVLAGIGVVLLTARDSTKGRTWSALLWRSGILLILGLALQLLPHDVNVILPLYAGLFLIAGLLILLPRRWLLAAASVMTLVGPVSWILIRQIADFEIEPATLGQNPLDIISAVLITGPYPLIVWIAPFLFGLWLGRLDLRDPRIQKRMVVAGAVVAAGAYGLSRLLILLLGAPDMDTVGWDRLVSGYGHSQMPLWLVSAGASAALVIGALLLLMPGWERAPVLRSAAQPLRATGQMALTAYCLHLVAIVVLVRPESADPEQGLLISLLIVIGLALLCTLWMALASRGPLEALLRPPIPARLTRRNDPAARRR